MISMSPTTPGAHGNHSVSYANSPPGSARSGAFKRSASSDDENGDHSQSGRLLQSRRNGTSAKRACNECRQQKLRCNVQREDVEKGIPFKACARCVKQNLACVIHDGFKRVGKRSKNAAMEKEMNELKERLAAYEQGTILPPAVQPTLNTPLPTSEPHVFGGGFPNEEDDTYLQTQHQQVAASSLLDLRSGSPMFHSLEDVKLAPVQINELFTEFFAFYHPFLTFLDPTRSPDDYAKDSRLLFWAIISVAARHYDADNGLLNRLKEPLTKLIWQTVMKSQPTHHVVKALCLLCTWPLPSSRTSTDPTFMFCGLMMQMAMQIGLHQPANAQDFSRTKVRLRQEDVHDRLRTWAVCNIVAQTVSTGHGQPSITLYDSTLEFRMDDEEHMKVVPPNLFVRLRQEMAASRITKLLYSDTSEDRNDPVENGSASAQKLFYMNLEAGRLQEEQGSMDGVDKELEGLNHAAVYLHLRLYAFFNTDMRLGHRNDLLDVYFAAIAFLDRAFQLQKQERLKYVPYYIMQMVLAAGCALLKLLNSDFANNLPFDQGRQYVVRTIDAMRKSKVMQNDLHDRFAEVLAQLWHEGSGGRSLQSTSQSPVVSNPSMTSMYNAQRSLAQAGQAQPPTRRGSSGALEEPLRLRLRSRMSMSVVFDCIQRWRESKANGAAEVLDSTVVNNPTNPDSSGNSPPPTTAGMLENPTHTLPQFNPHLNTLSMPLQLPNGLANANNFEIFDPMSWYLDSHQPDWPQQPFGSGGFGHDFGA
ncbi:hypothetical protein GQ43DRAFT_223739 [Delitschia confertaspora ATCC 74209]|uniref:Zn(2)-C6 fungal-type domain-containing protein n=1 Tax=Delitschia confertaspora ATCC 74209 TaxID=1513339 RepID=A0A9P4JD63_9PLEO|nr:hypothetical protein GQ43DRAFT_223739 [Delitschia confertaspora ATCC 74209]